MKILCGFDQKCYKCENGKCKNLALNEKNEYYCLVHQHHSIQKYETKEEKDIIHNNPKNIIFNWDYDNGLIYITESIEEIVSEIYDAYGYGVGVVCNKPYTLTFVIVKKENNNLTYIDTNDDWKKLDQSKGELYMKIEIMGETHLFIPK